MGFLFRSCRCGGCTEEMRWKQRWPQEYESNFQIIPDVGTSLTDPPFEAFSRPEILTRMHQSRRAQDLDVHWNPYAPDVHSIWQCVSDDTFPRGNRLLELSWEIQMGGLANVPPWFPPEAQAGAEMQVSILTEHEGDPQTDIIASIFSDLGSNYFDGTAPDNPGRGWAISLPFHPDQASAPTTSPVVIPFNARGQFVIVLGGGANHIHMPNNALWDIRMKIT